MYVFTRTVTSLSLAYLSAPQVLFAEAPIDSDVFLSYIHHNYTAFTNDVDECLGIVEGMSTADGLMRLEGEDVSLLFPPSRRERTAG